MTFQSWRRLQPGFSWKYFACVFKSHFRLIRGTFEALCREVQAIGRVPQQQHAFGRPPIPLDKQVLVFVWFTANSEVIRSLAEKVAAIFPYGRYGREGPGTGKNLCETGKWNTQFYRKIFQRENGTTFSEVPFFSRKFSIGTNRKLNHVPFTTQPEFPEFLGKWKTPKVTTQSSGPLNSV